MSDTVSVAEAADRLGVHESTLRNLIARGESPVPALHIGRRIRIPIRPLDRLLNGEPTHPESETS